VSRIGALLGRLGALSGVFGGPREVQLGEKELAGYHPLRFPAVLFLLILHLWLIPLLMALS
jgi:hypothetical protein